MLFQEISFITKCVKVSTFLKRLKEKYPCFYEKWGNEIECIANQYKGRYYNYVQDNNYLLLFDNTQNGVFSFAFCAFSVAQVTGLEGKVYNIDYENNENNENNENDENAINTDNNISELTKSVIELDKLNKSNTKVSEKSKEFLKEVNALSKDIITNAVDSAIKNTNKALLRIKINNLMCFTYLLTQAICKFLQNCNKVPNNTSGFIRYMRFNFLGILFNIQVIDGKIIYVNFGCLSMYVNNRCNYKAYDYVLDCYIYFSNIYYNIGRWVINAYRHIHINSYRKVTTQHILLKQFCGSYAENHS